MCEEMRKERGPIMKLLGFDWSDSIDCSQLPQEGVENRLCIPHPSYDSEQQPEQEEETSNPEYEEEIIQPSIIDPIFLSNENELDPQSEIVIPSSDVESNKNLHPLIDRLDYPVDPSIEEIKPDDYENSYSSENYNYIEEDSIGNIKI